MRTSLGGAGAVGAGAAWLAPADGAAGAAAGWLALAGPAGAAGAGRAGPPLHAAAASRASARSPLGVEREVTRVDIGAPSAIRARGIGASRWRPVRAGRCRGHGSRRRGGWPEHTGAPEHCQAKPAAE